MGCKRILFIDNEMTKKHNKGSDGRHGSKE